MKNNNLKSLPLIVTAIMTMGVIAFTACKKEVTNSITSAIIADEPFTTTWNYVPDQYIVVFDKAAIGNPQLKLGKNPLVLKQYVEGVINQMTTEAGLSKEIEVQYVYSNTINGFSAKMSEEAALKLKANPKVQLVEQDIEIHRRGKPGGSSNPPAQVTPWGISRVNGVSSYSGSSVAWILDTGIDLDHPDLKVDDTKGFNAFTTGKDAKSLDDGNGHGTHVAGTIAAKNNDFGVIGVAPGATVIPVKVLDSRGSGFYSGVIAGVDWVKQKGSSGDVANMSLGGPPSNALDQAVKDASAEVKFCLAAGNESESATLSSPARVNGTNIFTISAMQSGDKWASFSNYGNPPIDYCAPGVSILSTWKGGGYNTISGTSMATPHAAGVLLLGAPSSGGTVSNDPDGNADIIIKH